MEFTLDHLEAARLEARRAARAAPDASERPAASGGMRAALREYAATYRVERGTLDQEVDVDAECGARGERSATG